MRNSSSIESYKRIDDAFDAIYYHQNEILQLFLLEKYCNLEDINESTDKRNHPLLHHCIYCSNIDAIKLLLSEKNIDVNRTEPSRGWTALHETVYFGRDDMASMLISKKECDIWRRNSDGQICVEMLDRFNMNTPKCGSLVKRFQKEVRNTLVDLLSYVPLDIINIIVCLLYF